MCLLPQAKERTKIVCREQNAQTHHKATKSQKAKKTPKYHQHS